MLNFRKTLKTTAKAPRDQLDRCAFLMKLCMEAKKAAHSEDGTKPATMTAADAFVDQACKYVTDLADTTKDVTDSAREEEWKAVKEATAPVLNMLPSNMASSMKTELKTAEDNSKKVGEKMKEIPKVVGKGSGTVTVKLYVVGGPGKAVVGEDYEIKPRTPPSGLATIVLYKHKDGCLPNFYSSHPHPIDTSPADWGSEPTPLELYVVMDRGRFEFRFKITIYSPITETWVFRNLFKLEKLLYLKDSGGKLHPAPNGRFDSVVHCTRIQRTDHKRIAGPYPCGQWSETLKYIGEANDADWIVEPEKEEEKLQSPTSPISPYSTASPILTASSSLTAVSNLTSPTLSIPSTPPIMPDSIFPFSIASAASRTPSPPPHPPRMPPRINTATASRPHVNTPPIRTTVPPPYSPIAPVVLPTTLPVTHPAVSLPINSAVLSVVPPIAVAAPLAVPSVTVRPAMPSATASASKGGIFGRAVKWTKKTLGI